MKRSALFACLVLLSLFSRLNAQQDLDTYLEQHHVNLFNNPEQSLLLDEAFYNSRFVLLGETHGFAQAQEADMILLKLLYQKGGVRHYIAEVDNIKAWMLNAYLKDGKEDWLKKVFSSWIRDTAQWANKEYYEKYKSLYAYQQSLPAAQKITVIGIDQVQDTTLVAEYLKYLSKGVKAGPYQAALTQLTNSKQLQQDASSFLALLDKEEKKAAAVFGGNYPALWLLLKNLAGMNTPREPALFNNLQQHIKAYGLQDKKMYGFLGVYHCMQTSYNGGTPFASLLKGSLAVNEHVTSMVSFYTSGAMMLPYIAQMRRSIPAVYAHQLWEGNPVFAATKKYLPIPFSNSENNPMMRKIDSIEYITRYSTPNAPTLFKLNGKDSPFANSQVFAEMKGAMGITLTNKTDNTLNAFQYLLLFSQAKPATPID